MDKEYIDRVEKKFQLKLNKEAKEIANKMINTKDDDYQPPSKYHTALATLEHYEQELERIEYKVILWERICEMMSNYDPYYPQNIK
jgi:hypothetical protein